MYYDQVNDVYSISKMGQIIKVQWPVLAACIIGLYYRPVCDIRGRIYNSVARGIIVQICLKTYVCIYVCLMTYVCIYVCLMTYACVYICLLTCVCVYMFNDICVHLYMFYDKCMY
jgi:hypothetical protein